MKNIKLTITIQYQKEINGFIYRFSFERKLTFKNGKFIEINNNFSLWNIVDEIFDKILKIERLPANVLAVAFETENGVLILKQSIIPFLSTIRIYQNIKNLLAA